VNLVDHYLANYGYLTVAAGVGAESVGLPLPGETILIAAATYAGASHRLSTGTVVVVAMAAAIVGDNIGYGIGHLFGPRLLARLDRRLGRRSRHLRAVQQLFDRYGSSVVVAGRFVSLVRTYAAFLAGTQRMPWRRFLALNAAGGAAWAAAVGFGAAALGASIGQWGSYALTAGVVGGFAVVVMVVNRRTKRHRPVTRPVLEDVSVPAL
jgi:membrane protein DedA with SNARE-associated domain